MKKEKKKVTTKGVCYAYDKKRIDDNKVRILFNYTDPLFGETKSEISVLEYVARSYGESCIYLLTQLKQYDSYKHADYDHFYLPAMFCFRHCLELRLKVLYMRYTQESFDNNHTLNGLLQKVKEAGFQESIFDEPVNYIENIECKQDAFLRYIISTNFEYPEYIDIPLSDCDKIINWVNQILTSFSTVDINNS